MVYARDLYEKCIAAYLSNYDFDAKKAAILEVLKCQEPDALSDCRLYTAGKITEYTKLKVMAMIIEKLIIETKANQYLNTR